MYPVFERLEEILGMKREHELADRPPPDGVDNSSVKTAQVISENDGKKPRHESEEAEMENTSVGSQEDDSDEYSSDDEERTGKWHGCICE